MLAGDRKARPRPWEPLKQLSDRTPLRTKLITAMLALVIMALAAISITSVVVLRTYLYTERDSQLTATFGGVRGGGPIGVQLDDPRSIGAGAIWAVQQPGTQLIPNNPGSGFPGMGNPRQVQSLPELPAGNLGPVRASP